MMDRQQSKTYRVSYTTKDLILYALSLGMGSQPEDAPNEAKYLYERHDLFTGFPTFCLAFTFWARSPEEGLPSDKRTTLTTTTTTTTTTQGIPPFPPPLMADAEVIPRRFLRDRNFVYSSMPVIHTWQSIVWERPLEVPREINGVVNAFIAIRPILVRPKSIGTFVTSESRVTTTTTTTTTTSVPQQNRRYRHRHRHHQQQEYQPGQPQTLLCTIQSTALVLGMDPNGVISYDAGVPTPTSHTHQHRSEGERPPVFEWTYQTSPSQALLYRLASGDSNHIHVDTSVSEMIGKPGEEAAPLLHGLFTLALALRGVQKKILSETKRGCSGNGAKDNRNDRDRDRDRDRDPELFFRSLEGRFKAPAFVGDCLCVKIWEDGGGGGGRENDDKQNKTKTKSKTKSKSKSNTNTNSDSDSDSDSDTISDSIAKKFRFVITNPTTEATVVDNGCLRVEIAAGSERSAQLPNERSTVSSRL